MFAVGYNHQRDDAGRGPSENSRGCLGFPASDLANER